MNPVNLNLKKEVAVMNLDSNAPVFQAAKKDDSSIFKSSGNEEKSGWTRIAERKREITEEINRAQEELIELSKKRSSILRKPGSKENSGNEEKSGWTKITERKREITEEINEIEKKLVELYKKH